MRQLLNKLLSPLLQLSPTCLIWLSADSSLLLLSRLSCPDSDSVWSVTRPEGWERKVTSFIFSAFLGLTARRWNVCISTFHCFDPTGGKGRRDGQGHEVLGVSGATVVPSPVIPSAWRWKSWKQKKSLPPTNESRARRHLTGWRFRAQQLSAVDTVKPPAYWRMNVDSLAYIPVSSRLLK